MASLENLTLKIAAEIITMQIAKLDMRPGQLLAIIAPEEWGQREIQKFAEEFQSWARARGIEGVILPHGTELAVVTPPAGFSEDGG